MRHIYASLAICALASALLAAACGGGDGGGDGGTGQPAAAATATSAPSSSGASSGSAPAPKATPTPRASTSVRPTPTPVASFAAVTPWFQSGTYNIGTAAGTALLRAELLRELVTRYFDAVNTYDLNALLPLLEEGYRTDTRPRSGSCSTTSRPAAAGSPGPKTRRPASPARPPWS